MPRFGFCGPTYQSQSPALDAERCINHLPEIPESQGAKSALALYDTPGLKLAYNIGATAVIGQFACRPNGTTQDRLFAVVQSGLNQSLYELFPDGTKNLLGSLLTPTSIPVSFAENGTQLLICTGGQLWVLDLATDAITGPILGLNGPVSMVGYCDGFGIALLQNSNVFQVSALLDFTTWPGLGVGQVSEFPDNVISMIVNQRGIWFLGTKATVPYYNQGALNVPFLPVQGVYIENGCGAVQSPARLDNSIFWLDMNERGQGTARRANGYTPQRISNHAVETIWNSYPKISDAVGYAYEEAGHAFYVLYFPSGTGANGKPNAGATWVYDVATGMWHERAFMRKDGFYEAHHSQNHAFANGKHYVGDWTSGNVYQQFIGFHDDAGSPIVRTRISPHVAKENEWMNFSQFELDAEVGLAPVPPLTGSYSGPGISKNLIIPDQNNNPYVLSISDEGNIVVTPGTGTIQKIILNDGSVSGVSYLLTFDSLNSQLTPVVVPFSSANLVSLPMSTTPSSKQSALLISGGQMQVIPPIAPPRSPQVLLYISKDAGHTWSNNPYVLSLGLAGQFRARAVARKLGRARVWTFKTVYSDPVPLRIIDAYLKSAQWPPQERLSKQLAKMA